MLNVPTGRKAWSTTGVKKVRAKNPNTTVGIPASTSSVGLSTLRTRVEAYSER